jgi:hypothetical protein
MNHHLSKKRKTLIGANGKEVFEMVSKRAGRAYREKNIKRILHAMSTDEYLIAKDISNKVNVCKDRGYAGRDFNGNSCAAVLRWLVMTNRNVKRKQVKGIYLYKKIMEDEV